jgi:hypothetical protein
MGDQETMTERNRHIIEQSEHRLIARYGNCEIVIDRENENQDWYIQATSSNGCMRYDGWWQGSQDKSIEEALEEAIHGARL